MNHIVALLFAAAAAHASAEILPLADYRLGLSHAHQSSPKQDDSGSYRISLSQERTGLQLGYDRSRGQNLGRLSAMVNITLR